MCSQITRYLIQNEEQDTACKMRVKNGGRERFACFKCFLKIGSAVVSLILEIFVENETTFKNICLLFHGFGILVRRLEAD